MKRTALVLVGLLAAASAKDCGTERWSVKTGTDPDAGSVGSSAKSTTISTLTNLAMPDKRPPDNRIKPTEFHVYKIKATLTAYKEETDEDYHLVIEDSSGNTMIAEIPNPTCVGTKSPFKSQISSARKQFDAVFSVTKALKKTKTAVVVTGVGFFDPIHGQVGVAPNGIELHPVLDIEIDSSVNLTETRMFSKAQNVLLERNATLEDPAPSSADAEPSSSDEEAPSSSQEDTQR